MKIEKRAETVSINGFRLRSEVPKDDPVYQAVKGALEVRSDITNFVFSITIRDRHVCNRNGREETARQRTKKGVSEIEIFARSLHGRGKGSREREARASLVHELDHADYDRKVAEGIYLDGKLSPKEIEERARRAEWNSGYW